MPAIVDCSFIEHAICKYYPRCCGGWGGGAALNTFKFLWNGLEEHKNVVIHLADFHFMKENFNPIQDGVGVGGAKSPPYQFFPCNFYKRRNWPLKLSDF